MAQGAPKGTPKMAKDAPKMAKNVKMSVSPRRERHFQLPNLENERFASTKTPFKINLS